MFVFKKIFRRSDSLEVICLSYKQEDFDVRCTSINNNRHEANNVEVEISNINPKDKTPTLVKTKSSQETTNNFTSTHKSSENYKVLGNVAKSHNSGTKVILENDVYTETSNLKSEKVPKETKANNDAGISNIKKPENKNQNIKSYEQTNKEINNNKSITDKKTSKENKSRKNVTKTEMSGKEKMEKKSKKTTRKSKEETNKKEDRTEMSNVDSKKQPSVKTTKSEALVKEVEDLNIVNDKPVENSKLPATPKGILKKPKKYPDYEESPVVKYLQESVDSQIHSNKQTKMESKNRRKLIQNDNQEKSVKSRNFEDDSGTKDNNISRSSMTYSSYATSLFFDNDDSEI